MGRKKKTSPGSVNGTPQKPVSSAGDEVALAQSSELLSKALGNTEVIIFLKDCAGKYIVMSPWYEKEFYGKKSFLGKTDYDFYPKEYADTLREHDKMTMEASTLMEFQEVIPHGGRLDTSIAYKFPVFDHQGKVCGVCGFSTPMTTDCQQALETFKMSAGFYSLLFNTIRENEVRYHTLFEAANDAIFLVKDDVLVDCNRKAMQLFRCHKDKILGEPFLKFSPATQSDGSLSEPLAFENVKRVMDGGEHRFEWRHRKNDGTEFDSEVTLNRMELSGETYIQAIVRDITEKKHAEEEKQQTLKTLRTFMENSPAVIFIKDKEGRYIDVNGRFLDLFGLIQREDVIGKTDYDLLPKEQSEVFRDGDRRALAGEILDYELVLELPGRTEAFIDHKFAITDENGEPYAICGAATNITARKEAEKSLEESKEQYRTLADHVADGVMLVQDGSLSFVNDAVVSMFGYENKEELEGKQTSALFSPEDQDRFLEVCVALLDGVVEREALQAECVSRSNRRFWIEGEYTRVNWKGAPAVLGTVRDITEVVLRERAMQEETEQVRNELVKLKSSLKDRYRLGDIIGKTPAMQKVYEQILKAAGSDANVVILGESGTGKELVARAIHDMSVRAGHGFIPVNCGAIPDNLVESEFFGYRKGAFTGADADKKGYFYSAKGGTLFLDEVGEIPLSMQVKLLRAVETGEYTMLGDTASEKADVRIIGATSKGLSEMVARGQMREDFYYRVSVIVISLPPLRKRRDDIPLLAAHFLNVYGRGKKVDVPGRIMEAIYNHSWPGNVRELQNAIQRYLAVGTVDFEEMPGSPRRLSEIKEEVAGGLTSLESAVEDFERRYIQRALEEHRWAKGKTAEALSINPKTLYRKMKKIGL